MACIADPSKQAAGDADTDVTFLYELQPGPCYKSYGVNVARLARLPASVVALAQQKSEEFARSSKVGPGNRAAATAGKEVLALAKRAMQLCDADAADAEQQLEQLKALQAEAKATLGV